MFLCGDAMAASGFYLFTLMRERESGFGYQNARPTEQQSHVENNGDLVIRNNCNKRNKLWVSTQPFVTQQLLNSTVETHHKLHVFESLEFWCSA